jgi:hypothetical protein
MSEHTRKSEVERIKDKLKRIIKIANMMDEDDEYWQGKCHCAMDVWTFIDRTQQNK